MIPSRHGGATGGDGKPPSHGLQRDIMRVLTELNGEPRELPPQPPVHRDPLDELLHRVEGGLSRCALDAVPPIPTEPQR